MKQTLVNNFKEIFASNPEFCCSCGGRFEILGNHTDHNHGKCLAATCSLSIYAALSKRSDNIVRIKSEGYELFEVDLSNLDCVESEKSKPASFIRGIGYYLNNLQYKIGGFDAYINSQIPSGAGVSSSAAFELLIGYIFNYLYNNEQIQTINLSKAGQFAERNYYGKMCGLLDQIGVAFGGSTYIDFENIESPIVEPIPVKIDGYHFLIINSGGSHSGLDHLYKAIPDDMFEVAHIFDKNYLREVDEQTFNDSKDKIIKTIGVDKYNRALHFYNENNRVELARTAIKENNIDNLMKLMNETCDSCTNLLKNMMVDKLENSPLEACQLVREIGKNNIGVKINGGGFAGSIICLIKDIVYKDIYDAAVKKYGSHNVFEISIRNSKPSILE